MRRFLPRTRSFETIRYRQPETTTRALSISMYPVLQPILGIYLHLPSF